MSDQNEFQAITIQDLDSVTGGGWGGLLKKGASLAKNYGPKAWHAANSPIGKKVLKYGLMASPTLASGAGIAQVAWEHLNK